MTADHSRSYSRVGGHIALDLLNTVEWRLDPRRAIEDLPDYESILAWAAQCDILSNTESADLRRLAATAPPTQVAEEHRRFLQLRETAYEALVNSSPDAADGLTSTYRQTLENARLRQDGSNWIWSERSITLRTPHDRGARHVIALLTSSELGQLHQCEDAACGWVYLDTSPRHNRRWCAATDCGNRNRVRRYYARRRTGNPPAASSSNDD
jgi:predicted RNA-binding Zn ribbon-like protein